MNPYLTNVLLNGPELMAREFRRLPRSDWDRPLAPGRFTPREICAHLADWEPVNLARMKQAISKDGSRVEDWDEGAMAERNSYAQGDPSERLARLMDERKATLQFLLGLDGPDWACAVVHPTRGRMTVADMANLLLGHDLYHLRQLSDYSH